MTLDKVRNLKRGDKVFWTDPDDGLTSRHITLESIEVDEGNEIISVYGEEDDYLQCYAHELS